LIKTGLIAFSCFAASLWIACAFLWWKPGDLSMVPANRTEMGTSTDSRRINQTITEVGEDGIAAATSMAATPSRSVEIETIVPYPLVRPDFAAPASKATEANSDARAESAATGRHVPLHQSQPVPVASTPATSVPQFWGDSGYVFDADSVVVAPRDLAKADDAAQRRREARLTMDVGKLP
jgi:hypothetical protein